MVSDGYFSISFEGILGFLVTLVSVGLIIKQLSEARLASQMEGYLTLMGRFGDISAAVEFIDDLGVSNGRHVLGA